MRYDEIKETIQFVGKVLSRAEHVYVSTAKEYDAILSREKKDTDNAIVNFEKNAKRQTDDKRRELAQKLNSESDYLRMITEGTTKWRSLLSCCAKIKQEDGSDKKSMKAAREVISILSNIESASTANIAGVYEMLDSRMEGIEKKKLKKRQRQHIFRMMLLCEKYARGSRNRVEKDINSEAQENIIRIEFECEEKKRKLREKSEESRLKNAQNCRDDIDFIVSSTIESCADRLLDKRIVDAVLLKKEYRELYCLKDDVRMRDDGVFPHAIYMGDAVYPLTKLSISRFMAGLKGSLKDIVDENGLLSFPLTHRFNDCKNYMFMSNTDVSHSADVMNDFMFQFCQQLPPGDVEMLIVDPVKKGLSIKQFLTFREMFPNAFGDKVYTTAQDIKKCLSDISSYIDNVIQHSLANKFENIAEYNSKVTDNRLPIKLLCFFNLSKCIMSSNDANVILDILENSARCGICVLMDYDEQCMQSSPFNPQQQKRIAALCDGFDTTGECPVGDGGIFLMQNAMPQGIHLERFFAEYAAAAKSNRAKGVGFAEIKPDKLFGFTSAKGLIIPVGKASDSGVESIEFGKVGSSHHALITGGTGSGKSTLLHTIIISAAQNYSPTELNMYLMDFKSGTEFKVYETYKIPHIKLLALDAMQEFGESILADINAEMERRSKLFKEAGVSGLPEYIAATGKNLPRLLIIMDEFQVLFSTSRNRKVANECARLANAIVKLGRSFGVHLIMSTQSLGVLSEDSSLDSSTVEQMRIRIGLKFDDKEAKRLFGDNDIDALRKMRGAIGTAVYNKDFTECENVVFRTAYCDDAAKRDCLTEITVATSSMWPDEMKVFEGTRVPDYPMQPIASKGGLTVPIGEPIKVDDPVALNLSRKKTANIAVIGTKADLMKSATNLILLGLLRNENVKLHYADGDSLVDETPDTLTMSLIRMKPPQVEQLSTRTDIVRCVDMLYELYRKRRKGQETSSENHVLFVNHTQNVDIIKLLIKGDRVNRDDYIKSLSQPEGDANAPDGSGDLRVMYEMAARRRGMSNSEGENPSLSVCFREIAENGFGFGIYIVVTFDDPAAAVDALGHATIASGMSSKFPNKIVFGVGEDQCGKIISDMMNSPSNDAVAVYTNGVSGSRQLKLYKLPEMEEIKKLIGEGEVN